MIRSLRRRHRHVWLLLSLVLLTTLALAWRARSHAPGARLEQLSHRAAVPPPRSLSRGLTP